MSLPRILHVKKEQFWAIIFLIMACFSFNTCAEDEISNDLAEEDWSEYEEIGGDGDTIEIGIQEEGSSTGNRRTAFFHRLDPYYSSIGLVFTLDDEPTIYSGSENEKDVYKNLFLRSFRPGFLTLELSTYPMPLLGVAFKKHDPEFYDQAEISNNLNLIESLTAGFDEPYSVTIMLNNITSYNTKNADSEETPNIGFMGYLVNFGTYHIQRNVLVEDNWVELVWKTKGKFNVNSEVYSWGFRVGAKTHDNKEITDTFFVSINRDHTDYNGPAFSWLKNSGAEFTYVVSQADFSEVKFQLLFTRYFPVSGVKKFMPSIVFGAIWENDNKYSGSLQDSDRGRDTIFVIQPSIFF